MAMTFQQIDLWHSSRPDFISLGTGFSRRVKSLKNTKESGLNMERNKFTTIDPLVDKLAESIDELVAGDRLESIKQQVVEISARLGEQYSVTLEFNLQVHDHHRENSLPLLQTGLATANGANPYQCWGDSSPHRYVVDGELMVVPHDHCPSCWGQWDFKDLHPTCPQCGISMGKQVKWLLDNDMCPHCEKSSVSAASPTCSRCGYSVNPAFIFWG
jgi:ribosomal protein S27AE